MKRPLIAALSLLAVASTAAIADPGNGPRHRDLVHKNREAREAVAPPQPQTPEVTQRDDRSPRFARDDRRHDDRRHDDRRHDNKRYEDKRHDDRRHDDRRWRDDGRRYDDRRYDDRRRDDRHWNGRRDHRDARGRHWHYDQGWYQTWRHRHYRYDGGRYYARDRFRLGLYVAPRGYAYRVWRSGDWLPRGYWYDAPRHELRSAWRYGLYEAPYWATWVRVGDDALLIDRDTGEVIDVVYEIFW